MKFEQKNKLKKRFKEITDRDLTYALGKESIMLQKLNKKLGISKKELLNIIIEY